MKDMEVKIMTENPDMTSRDFNRPETQSRAVTIGLHKDYSFTRS